MKKLLLIFGLCYFGILFSQNGLVVRDLQPKSENRVFPEVLYKEKSLVAEKINTFLQYTLLDFIPNSSKNPFNKITNEEDVISRLNFFGWEKYNSPKHILSLKIDGDATGAYTEEYANYENFDIRSGNHINMNDIFTKTGLLEIQKIVNNNVQSQINNFIKKANKALKVEKNKDEINRLDEQIFLYESCGVKDYSIEYVKYYFEKDRIIFERERCSAHVNRAIDDLNTFTIPVQYQKIQNYLSPFGKSLLFNQGNVQQNSVANRIFKGKIKNSLVTFVINQIYDDHSVGISYWYDNFKEKIDLRGSFKNNHFSLIEDDYHSEELKAWVPKAFIEADFKGNKIIGTWENYKTKEKLKIELAEL